jgi:hypothetical protein
MSIALIGQVNVSGMKVPQTLVQIVPPQFLFNGVQTNVVGLVGTASWGPVDLAQPFGSYAEYVTIFGPTINRYNDLGGAVILAQAQGAAYFAASRVTDGTDTAASGTVLATGGAQATGTVTYTTNPTASSTVTLDGTVWTYVSALTSGNQILIQGTLALTLAYAAAVLNASTDANTALSTYTASSTVLTITAKAVGTGGNALTLAASVGTVSGATLSGGAAGTTGLTLTAKYTGTLGNTVTWILQPGSAKNSYRIVLTGTNLTTETYDSVGAGLTGNALWIALANAVNNGSSTARPASNLVVATAGSATAVPVTGFAGNTTLSGGTDGVTSITTSVLLGVDSAPRTGMYSLRGQNCAQIALVDCSDLTSLSTQVAFGSNIGAYMIMATPLSDTLTNAQTELNQMGIDSFVAKVLFGDWILWTDTVNKIQARLSSPASVSIGFFGNASPQVNSLNKPLYGFWGTQSSALGRTYSAADFQVLAQSRMDIIALDQSLSNSWIHRLGINTSSDEVIYGDEYTRVVFWLALSIQIVGNQYVGANMTPTEMNEARTALQQFLALAQKNGVIYTFDGSQAYQVVLDTSNNSQATAALGYQFAYVMCVIGPIVRFFVINLEAGSSVVISSTAPNGSGLTPIA